MEVRKRSSESSSSLIYRFTRRTQQSGITREARKRRFHVRPESRRDRRLSALHRAKKKEDFDRAKKLGIA